MNKGQLGQYFTPDHIVKKMVGLMENNGSILEPSCGDGAFLSQLPCGTIGLEIDPSVAPEGAVICDFFDYSDTMDTIIGNPPYVRYKDIYEETKKKLPNGYNMRTNLYVFFIDRSIDLLKPNGELIFIVPRDFIKTSSAARLNERLYNEGGFTYWEEFGDAKIFADASPNVVIFRWVKGASHVLPVSYRDGYLFFSEEKENKVYLEELFTIMVGGASGANKIFINDEEGNIDLVVSDTKKSGSTKKAIYLDAPSEYLKQHKEELISRKIKKFNENNWWEWGRKIRHIDGEKIYVNNKTRDMKPFFTNTSGWFDGSILALVPKDNTYDIDFLIDLLNENNWEEQGFLVGGRLVFGQRSLEKAYVCI